MTLNSQLGALLVFHCAVVLLLLTHTSADSVSCPAIDIIKGADGVLLECKSAGNREAEVLLLDSVGNIISERAKKISSVTLDNKHNNTYTCKLQQDNITQTLQTRVFIQRDTLTPSSCSGEHIALAVLVVCMVLLAVAVFGVWKWKQRKLSTTEMNHEDETQHNEMENQPLKGKETETEEAITEKSMLSIVNKLMDLKEELKIQMKPMERCLMEDEEKQEKNQEKLVAVAKEIKNTKFRSKLEQSQKSLQEEKKTLIETTSKLMPKIQNIETQLKMLEDIETEIPETIKKKALDQRSSAQGSQGTSDSI
ncbi:uncharacterized protein LOC143010538 isoform X2 [Genypterus blacodes]|uniref:uncharacterized protein LOC143010538 isoform X2 n=1 Tax=Genypterus blacodes TaxID=154954 RepID=UPI003F76F137